MTSLTVEGGAVLRGTLRVPGDKSISHRALLLAALAPGESNVEGLSDGDDVARTRAAIVQLGAEVEGERIRGGALHQPAGPLDVGNSGTTMRLLAGMCAGFDWPIELYGDESLSRRPMDRIATPLGLMGATVTGTGPACLPPILVEGGRLVGVDYLLPVASAQVKGAVMLAGLRAEGETIVREGARTRAHTEEMLGDCGIDVATTPDGLTTYVRPSTPAPRRWVVPGDPSQAAFWLVAACILPGSDLVVDDVYLGPGRLGFMHVLARMGADVRLRPGTGSRGAVRARHGALRATEVAPEEVPGLIDEIPALAVAAAVAEGTTVFRGAGELRVKESDRVATVAEGLIRLGAQVETMPDGLAVTGPARLRGTDVGSHGDHRVALAMAVAGLAAGGVTTVEGWDATATSYPGFERDLRTCAS